MEKFKKAEQAQTSQYSTDTNHADCDPSDKNKSGQNNCDQANSKQSKSDRTTTVEQLKRLGVFQIKLGLDALRDILLSPLSILFTLMDLAEKNKPEDSHFNKLLAFGRRTERRINLFNQHDDDIEQAEAKQKVQTVDTLVTQIEDIIKKEYKQGELSMRAKSALEKTVKIARRKNAAKSEE